MHFSGKKNLSLRESDTGKCAAGIAAFKAAGVDGESIGSQLVWIGQKIVRGEGPVPHRLPGSTANREDERAWSKSQTWIPAQAHTGKTRGRVANHRLGSHDRLTIV